MEPNSLVVQATLGILQSFDRGASWSCEEVISTAGVAADPPLTTTCDGSLVLLQPRSASAGCLMVGLLRRRLRPMALALLAVALLGCSADGAQTEDAGMLDDDFRGCPDGYPSVITGLEASDDQWTVRVLAAMPGEPERYINTWTVAVSAQDGTAAQDLQITRGETFMPVHGHDGRVQPRMTALPEPGRFQVDRLNFTMRGPWEVRLWLRSGTREEERIVFQVCVAK